MNRITTIENRVSIENHIKLLQPYSITLFNSIKSKFVFSVLLVFAGLMVHGQCNFKPIGHRGGSSYYYPENTLVSIEQGFIEDIFAAEVDVQFTSDSILILMHDYFIDRTTDGIGEVEKLPLSYIKTLDAGSWKNPKYKGTPIPTLKEALQLAYKYNKKLYLNMKVFAPKLIARTLQEANVPGDIILIDPDDLNKVKIYHELMPNTPLVYFGDLPHEINDPSFYTYLKSNGVVAIEIPADYIHYTEDDEYVKLRDLAHSYHLELWAYTVNDPPYFRVLRNFGIDALETDRPSVAHQVFCENANGGYFPEKRITGQWDFNQNLNGTIGSKLIVKGDTTVEGQKIKFGTTQSFGLPKIENATVNIARIPAFDSLHSLRFFSNIAPEGLPGVLDCDNTYSLVFDILKPIGIKTYTSIYQTSNNNSDDADFFLFGSKNSFGVLEQYKGSFADSTWVRLVLIFDLYNEKMDEYLDGNFVATIKLEDSKNGRFCINNNWGVQSSNFFSDEDGETNPMFVSSIQLRNYSMTPDEVKLLGKCKSAKIDNTIFTDQGSECPEFKENIKDPINRGEIILKANAGDQVNYRWEMNRGLGWENITGPAFRTSPPSSLSIISNPGLYKGYKFRCIALNDCITISNDYSLKDYTEAYELPYNQTTIFKMYPNPSSRTVNIDFLQTSQVFDLTIYSILGIEVYKQNSVSGLLQINLSKGSYLVQVRNAQGSEVKKLIITN
jgi:glycerophosphoryl diester phosphodiesterase